MFQIFFELFFIYIIATLNAQNTTITISLNSTTNENNKELFGDYMNITSLSTIEVDFEDVAKNISFIIFQVHSHLYNVTLYNNTFVQGSYVSGTNVGLYSAVEPRIDTFFINNNNDFDLLLYISVHGYENKDPIPGGCNMEGPVPVLPYLMSNTFKDYITVDAGPAQSYNDQKCATIDDVFVLFYKMYLPERDFSAKTYFEGLRSMITLDKIELYGDMVPMKKYMMRRMLSRYPGTGTIYVAVAYNANRTHTAVYVPTCSYACSPLMDNDCDLFDDFLSEFLCAMLLFGGVFVCYFGHRFFKTEMFLMGALSGFLVSYIAIALMVELQQSTLLMASVLSAVLFGAIWLVFWWLYGIPVLAVFLSTLNLGFLLAAILTSLTGNPVVLEIEMNFWVLFLMIMILTSSVLLSMTLLSNILCCAVLGAYAVLFPIDFYLGTSLKYIVVNVVRRALVPKFNFVSTSIPFQLSDIILAVAWVTLATTGFLFQHYQSLGRPPFPPPPRSTRLGMRGYPRYQAVQSTAAQYEYGSDVVSNDTPAPPAGQRITERTALLG